MGEKSGTLIALSSMFHIAVCISGHLDSHLFIIAVTMTTTGDNILDSALSKVNEFVCRCVREGGGGERESGRA